MLTDETLKAAIEGILYVAPEPVPLDAIVKSLEGEERERVKAKLQELIDDYERAHHGIQIRQIAGGYKFSTKPEHHEVLRKFVKSLKPPIRLSKPALETLAVIAYRQSVTLPEIEAIRGVDCGGVIHTLLEKKLVVTAGRKNVVGRPILYRTSRDFLVHFGLKDVSELPSLKEFGTRPPSAGSGIHSGRSARFRGAAHGRDTTRDGKRWGYAARGSPAQPGRVSSARRQRSRSLFGHRGNSVKPSVVLRRVIETTDNALRTSRLCFSACKKSSPTRESLRAARPKS